MKLSCLPVSHYADITQKVMTVDEWAKDASDLKLDAIDLSVLFFKDHDVKSLESMRRYIEKHNISVGMVAAYPDFTHPSEDEREKQLELLKRNIELSTAVGAKMLRVTAGQAHPETERSSGIEWAVEGIKNSIETAEKHSVELLYENHSKPGVWDYTDFSTPSDIFLAIARKIEDTPVGILFDTANPMVFGDDTLPLLKQVYDKIECIHVADTKTRGALNPALIGEGLVPFNEIFHYLKLKGYEKWLSIEEASFLGKEGVEKAVLNTRKAWKLA